MTQLTLADRLRIERAVWTLNTLLQDVPGRARRSACRELRANLLASCADGGARAAIKRLGGLRRLAAGYLDAEYDHRPKPRGWKGLFWALAVVVVFFVLGEFGFWIYGDGLIDGHAAPGTYRWAPFGGWGPYGQFVMGRHGFISTLTMPLLPLLLYCLIAFVVGGRLWRTRLPRRRVTTELETA
jgi:hypothetical protein